MSTTAIHFLTAQNESTKPTQSDIKYWTEYSWIIPVTLNVLLVFVTLWILISLIHYGKKTKKWRKVRRKNAEKLHSGWVYSTVVACAGTVLIRLITSQVVYNIGFDDITACEIVNDALFIEYALMLFTTYLFLWLRQRVFYTNHMLNIDTTKPLRCLSAASLLIIFAGGVSVAMLNTIPSTYSSSPTGCVYRIKDNLEYETYAWMACAAILVIGQCMLVALLLYPLKKNAESEGFFSLCACCSADAELQDDVFDREPSSPSFVSDNKVKQSRPNKSERRSNQRSPATTTSTRDRFASSVQSSSNIRKIMLRTIIFGSISLTTDLVMIILLSTSLLDASNPGERRFSVLIYDLNAFLNLMLVILSCTIYRCILTSLCQRKGAETCTANNRSFTSVSYM